MSEPAIGCVSHNPSVLSLLCSFCTCLVTCRWKKQTIRWRNRLRHYRYQDHIHSYSHSHANVLDLLQGLPCLCLYLHPRWTMMKVTCWTTIITRSHVSIQSCVFVLKTGAGPAKRRQLRPGLSSAVVRSARPILPWSPASVSVSASGSMSLITSSSSSRALSAAAGAGAGTPLSSAPLTTSETAKRILQTIDRLSTPLVDAKRLRAPSPSPTPILKSLFKPGGPGSQSQTRRIRDRIPPSSASAAVTRHSLGLGLGLGLLPSSSSSSLSSLSGLPLPDGDQFLPPAQSLHVPGRSERQGQSQSQGQGQGQGQGQPSTLPADWTRAIPSQPEPKVKPC